jgi:hypothetical protein
LKQLAIGREIVLWLSCGRRYVAYLSKLLARQRYAVYAVFLHIPVVRMTSSLVL